MPCAPDTLHHSTSSTSSSQQLRLELRLRRDGLAGSMAATAKHELRRNSPTGPASPTNGQPTSNGQSTTSQDDIAAIAKQISDHAEAIYQTWKSRGLAPTEILKCHTHVPGAADKFGSVLSPTRQQPQQLQQPTLGPADALASQDNNNLEKLVNKFVVEDKARRQRSPSKTLPSSIAFALQKFEQNGAASRQQQSPTTPTQLKGFGSRSPLKPAVVQPPSTGNYLDEVAREEERLINALKTGCVVADEDKPAVAQPVVQPKQKPLIVRETKPKVEPVKPILISPGLIAQRGFRLEPPGRKEPSPKPEQPPKTAEPEPKPAANKDEKDFIASRWGLRLNSSRPRPQEPVPHPELTTQQKQHIRQATAAASSATASNPVRPFLTRGSVAERVLIFEKCPSELLLDKRGPRQPAAAAAAATASPFAGPAVAATPLNPSAKPQPYARDKVQPPKSLPPHTTLQRHVKANRNVLIPRFYFPGGKPTPLSQAEATVSRITAAFQALPAHRASRSQFHTITKACDLPLYWKIPLFLASGGDTNGIIEMNEFLDFWKELTSSHHDAASKFVRIVTKGARSCILPEDLIPLVQDVVETHPGLTFLKEATEFHSRYVHTVIARIFYCVNRSWSGKISVAELRRSNLLTVISVLEHKEDINQVTAYFSYEHFYVIYCKFWELDRDHDLFIDKMDLTRHNDHALSTRMIERIFSGAVTRGVKSASGVQHPEDKMSYTEFVWFLLSEEDKNHPTAIEYWFRCMDLDGDGYLSMYELEYFYEEQLHRMEAIGIETLPFEDCLCQMLDMIHPAIPGKISLSDMKKCKMTSIFFDTFFNLEKYLDHEQRDPFASARDHDADGHELSDWDRFAAEEYELLVAEESGNDQNDQSLYDSCAEDAYSPNLDVLIGESVDAACQAERASSSSYLDEPGTQQQRPKSSHYDSCDSDDYADSDN